MGRISDSINILKTGKNKNADMIALPQGEFMRYVELNMPDGEMIVGRLDGYNANTRALKLSYSDKDGRHKVWELTIRDVSEEDIEAGKREREDSFPIFSTSGKLFYLSVLNPT